MKANMFLFPSTKTTLKYRHLIGWFFGWLTGFGWLSLCWLTGSTFMLSFCFPFLMLTLCIYSSYADSFGIFFWLCANLFLCLLCGSTLLMLTVWMNSSHIDCHDFSSCGDCGSTQMLTLLWTLFMLIPWISCYVDSLWTLHMLTLRIYSSYTDSLDGLLWWHSQWYVEFLDAASLVDSLVYPSYVDSLNLFFPCWYSRLLICWLSECAFMLTL